MTELALIAEPIDTAPKSESGEFRTRPILFEKLENNTLFFHNHLQYEKMTDAYAVPSGWTIPGRVGSFFEKTSVVFV